MIDAVDLILRNFPGVMLLVMLLTLPFVLDA
jgi:hypothetical protein